MRPWRRFALHSPTVDPPPGEPASWPGEAKVAGVVEELSDPTSMTQAHRFRLDLREVVHTEVADSRLRITSWHRDRGPVVRVRD